MFKRIILALIAAANLTLPATAQDLQKGMAAYERGDYAGALVEWRPLAAEGDQEAQYIVGLMYRRGQGLPQDFGKAVEFFRMAALNGHAGAQHSLGLSYREGQGLPINYVAAAMWCRKAANQGYSEAQHSLALSYAQGLGVPKDEIQAYIWWTMASLAGHQIADGFRKSVARNMTALQISKAEKLAQKWLEDFRQKRKLGSF